MLKSSSHFNRPTCLCKDLPSGALARFTMSPQMHMYDCRVGICMGIMTCKLLSNEGGEHTKYDG